MTLYCKNLYKICIEKGRSGGITILAKKELPLDLFTIYVQSIFKPKGGFQGKKKIEWEEFKKIQKEKIFKPVHNFTKKVENTTKQTKTFFKNLNVNLDNIIRFSKLTFGGGWYIKNLDGSGVFYRNLYFEKEKTLKSASVHFLTPVPYKKPLEIFYLDKKQIEKYRKRIDRLKYSKINELKKLIRVQKILSEIFYLDKKINSKRIKTIKRDLNRILFHAMQVAQNKGMKKELMLYQKIWRFLNDEIKRTTIEGTGAKNEFYPEKDESIRGRTETIDF